MLTLQPLQCSAASSLESDWDVEAEIVRELQELGQSDSNADPTVHEPAAVLSATDAAAPVEALFAALAAREQLADKLTITLQELHSLPQHITKPIEAAAPATASAEEVCAAVAALTRLPFAAGDKPTGCPGDASTSNSSFTVPQHVQCIQAAPQTQHAGAPPHPIRQQLADQPGRAVDSSKQVSLAVQQHVLNAELQRTCSESAPLAQLLQATPSHPGKPHLAADSTEPLPAARSQVATLPEPDQPVSPARPQLSPPHTPNTEDKRQHAAAALQAPQPQQQKQEQKQDASNSECFLPSEVSAGESSEVSHVPSTAASVDTAATAQALAAAAAAAAIAAEHAAAERAAAERLQDQARLQQVLQQQVGIAVTPWLKTGLKGRHLAAATVECSLACHQTLLGGGVSSST